MLAYRMLTGNESSEFCHKVTKALDDGWSLHGAPTMAFDPVKGEMRCGQAVVKEVEGSYSPELKLGQL